MQRLLECMKPMRGLQPMRVWARVEGLSACLGSRYGLFVKCLKPMATRADGSQLLTHSTCTYTTTSTKCEVALLVLHQSHIADDVLLCGTPTHICTHMHTRATTRNLPHVHACTTRNHTRPCARTRATTRNYTPPYACTHTHTHTHTHNAPACLSCTCG